MANDSVVSNPPKLTRWNRAARVLKWVGLGALVFFLALLTTGYFYESLALKNMATEFPPPGELVDVGGRHLHLEVRGRGRPTVVFESGLGAVSWDWSLVAPEVAKFTQVVSYDRAGLGWSDPGPSLRNADQVVDDLYAALTARGIEGPYVLVGHSLGGIYVRRYYQRHPQDVIGVVLVDSSHEMQRARLPNRVVAQLDRAERLASIGAQLARFGMPRMMMDCWGEVPDQIASLPQEAQNAWRARAPSRAYLQAVSHEFASFRTSTIAQSEPTSWKDLPLIVLSAGRQPREMAREWERMQIELASLSTRGEHHVVSDSNHNINIHRPDVIVQAVRRLVVTAGKTSDGESAREAKLHDDSH